MRLMIQFLLLLVLTACITCSAMAAGGSITKSDFGKTTDTTPVAVDLYTLTNATGATAKITNYGGIVVSLTVPDRDGKLADVVLGYDKLSSYIESTPYFGALIGRYGNRIAGGKFTLDGKACQVTMNEVKMGNMLHGGKIGFDKVVWTATPKMTDDGPSLELAYVSKDGEEGFPGTLTTKAVYTWTNKNELKLEFTATTDKPTVVNLTNHSYFNLAGAGSGDNLKHVVTIEAAKMLPVDANLIPTGKLEDVKGTPFDFTKPHAIGERINADNEQIKLGGGYDHCWAIDKPAGELGLQARVTEPSSGRVLEVLSTEPGLQFYSGNFLDGSNIGKGGIPYQKRFAFCMEPEHYPDSPNKAQFPSTELKPGETYKHTMIYKFDVAKAGAQKAAKKAGNKKSVKKSAGKKAKKKAQ